MPWHDRNDHSGAESCHGMTYLKTVSVRGG